MSPGILGHGSETRHNSLCSGFLEILTDFVLHIHLEHSFSQKDILRRITYMSEDLVVVRGKHITCFVTY